MYISESNIDLIENCSFTDNYADRIGGALWSLDSNYTLFQHVSLKATLLKESRTIY